MEGIGRLYAHRSTLHPGKEVSSIGNKQKPDQDMGSLNSKAMTQSGHRPEEYTLAEREAFMLPEVQKANSKAPMKSYAAQSAEQAHEAKKVFISECMNRGSLFPSASSEAAYADPEVFHRTCEDYLAFCYNNNISMSMTNLALWLGLRKETILRILRNGDIDSRFETLSAMQDIMDYSMEQELTTYEGNSTGRIYFTKARLGWQEAAQQVDINIGLQQSALSKPDSIPEALNLIDITPEIE